MSQVSQNSGDISSRKKHVDNSKGTESGNTKVTGRDRSRSWIFTWNNYNSESVSQIISNFTNYVFQEEIGAMGTRHLQGFINEDQQISFRTLKEVFPEVHWERARNVKACLKYVQKSDTHVGQRWYGGKYKKNEIKDPMEGLIKKQWQLVLDQYILQPPDPRKILWFYNEKGGNGKSTYTKHLILKYGAFAITTGKNKDIKSALSDCEDFPKIVIIDIPRCQFNKICYTAIEEIKNGFFFSSKYESKMVVFNTPHLIVFANYKPDKVQLSEDRWEIFEIE